MPRIIPGKIGDSGHIGDGGRGRRPGDTVGTGGDCIAADEVVGVVVYGGSSGG